MRAFAIGAGNGGDEGGFLRTIHGGEARHGGVKGKAVRQRDSFLIHQRGAVGADVPVCDVGERGKPIHGAAQDDDHQLAGAGARIGACAGCDRDEGSGAAG